MTKGTTMKRIIATIAATLAAIITAHAAPPATPLTVNIASENLPQLTAYEASGRKLTVTVKNGSSAVDLTSYTPFVSWSLTDTASSTITATVAIVTATSGVFTATFDAADMNYDPGRYVYHIGLDSDTVRNGTLILKGSPYSSGADPADFGTNFNYATISEFSNTSTHGPYRFTGDAVSTITTNADGSINVNTTIGSGDITGVSITGVSITAGTGMTGTVATTSGQHTQTLAINAASVASLLLADSSLQPADTNAWVVSSHSTFVTDTDTNGWETGSHAALVTDTDTNGWETGSHSALVTDTDTNAWVVSSHSTFVTDTDTNGWITASHTTMEGDITTLEGYTNDLTVHEALDADAGHGELDPLWVAVSNTVTVGAAAGATALQAEVDTLQTVVTRGGTATGIGDLSGTGRRVFGLGLSVSDIAANSPGASQSGVNSGTMTIGQLADGSKQSGSNLGIMAIVAGTVGAQQIGYIAATATATTSGSGSMQLMSLTAGQDASTTIGGAASLLLGAGTASNKNSIVAGDGEQSYAAGSITAGGGFYGAATGLTAIPGAQITAGTVTSNALNSAAISLFTSGGSGGGNWWTNPPTTAVSFPTNDWVSGYVLTSTDGTNFYWAAQSGGAQTPWTSDIDAAGYYLIQLDYTSFETNSAAVSGRAGELVEYVKDGRKYYVYNGTTNYMELQ